MPSRFVDEGRTASRAQGARRGARRADPASRRRADRWRERPVQALEVDPRLGLRHDEEEPPALVLQKQVLRVPPGIPALRSRDSETLCTARAPRWRARYRAVEEREQLLGGRCTHCVRSRGEVAPSVADRRCARQDHPDSASLHRQTLALEGGPPPRGSRSARHALHPLDGRNACMAETSWASSPSRCRGLALDYRKVWLAEMRGERPSARSRPEPGSAPPSSPLRAMLAVVAGFGARRPRSRPPRQGPAARCTIRRASRRAEADEEHVEGADLLDQLLPAGGLWPAITSGWS